MTDYKSEVSPANVISHIFYVEFGYPLDTASKAEVVAFFKSMKDTYNELRRGGHDYVTLPAIRSWVLSEDRRIPRRDGANQFLYEHVNLLGEHKDDWSEERRNHRKRILNYLLSFSTFAPRSSAADKLGKRRIPPIPRRWTGDSKTWQRALELGGTYQLIRPSASADQKRYALEVIQIDARKFSDNSSVTMYSHTQPERRFMYRGDMNINGKYLFCLLNRRHEDVSGRHTFRSITIYTMDNSDVYSGIMTRGVSGNNRVRMAMAVPFIIFKVSDSYDLSNVDFIPQIFGHAKHLNNEILIGEVIDDDKQTLLVFEFCNNLFDALISKDIDKTLLDTDRIMIKTVPPNFLKDQVRKIIGRNVSVHDAWKRYIFECKTSIL